MRKCDFGHVHPGKTQISLDIRTGMSVFAGHTVDSQRSKAFTGSYSVVMKTGSSLQ